MLLLIALPVVGVIALVIWLMSTRKKGNTQQPLLTGLIITLVVVLVVGLVVGLLFLNQVFQLFNFGPGGMMSGRFNDWTSNWTRPSFKMGQAWPLAGMHGVRTGCRAYRPSALRTLSLAETEATVSNFLSDYGDDDLTISEIMIFDNHGYAVVSEKSTGMGAFELLIDPINSWVYPEHGPNRMWNLKYDLHGHAGMMGRRMMPGRQQGRLTIQDVPAEMPIRAAEAIEIAQDYLVEYYPGAVVSDHMTTFYGYYTIDVARDAEIFGMLSVNGFTGQVFYHHWHGNFVEMREINH